MDQIVAVEGPFACPDTKRHVALFALCAAQIQEPPNTLGREAGKSLDCGRFVPCLLSEYVFATSIKSKPVFGVLMSEKWGATQGVRPWLCWPGKTQAELGAFLSLQCERNCME